MKNKQLLVFCTGLFVLIQFFGNAQINENQEFLRKIGIKDSLYSKTLKEQRTFYIQLPSDYNPESNQKYPVAFIIDGDVLLPTVSNVQDYYFGGFMPEMLLVGISNANNRTRDLTTSKITEKFGFPFNVENGEADNFTQFIEAELIPFIENKYPVTNFRTLIGHSYGGLFTINMLVKHAHVFNNYLAIDPSLDWDNQKLLKEAQELLATQNYANKSFFMSLGGQLHMQDNTITIDNVMEDSSDYTLFARSNIAFSNMIKQNSKNGLSFGWKFYPRDLHGTIPLPSIMDGLISLFEWFQMENITKFNSPETPKEELLSIVNQRTKKLKNYFGYTVPPYPEDLFNGLGYMSLDMEQTEKSKMFFELAIQFYPNSPNTYDSMSEYYERMGDNTNALKFATKAYITNPTDHYKQRMETLKNK
jgi:hypothetical protein